MARRLLGDTIDIHAGGVDLIFPHHENEIAQAEGATGVPFSRFWVHVEHLMMDDDEKMSKSLGNVFTVRDVLDRGYRASALRYLLMSVHYRKQLKFSWDNLAQADEALKRLMDFLAPRSMRSGAPAPTTRRRPASPRPVRHSARWCSPTSTCPAASAWCSSWSAPSTPPSTTGDVGAPDVAVIRDAFDAFDRVLGVIALRRAEEEAPPDAGRGHRSAGRRAPGGPSSPRFRRRGPDPAGPRRAGHRPRGHRRRDEMEAEMRQLLEGRERAPTAA